jgi:hypothetical protein
MNNLNCKMNEELVFELLKAQSEDQVSSILLRNEIFKQENWTEFPEGNFGVIESQGRDPHRALVEKVTNSIDAVLLRECYKKGINPESSNAPKSISKAVELFFKVEAGDISGITEDKRDMLASQIYLIADKLKNKRANIFIIDQGEGQDPESFKETFLKFGGNKVRVYFLHGRFGTGSFGVLPNAGEKGYQLLISKKFINKSNYWGWTLMRKNSGDDLSTKHAWYEYFNPNNLIPKLKLDDLGSQIKTTIKYERLNIQEFKYGTIIKLFDYDLPNISDIDRDLARKLNRYLFAPALPFRILNAQTTSHVGPGKKIDGNINRLKKNKSRLELNNKISIQNVELSILGLIDIDVYVGKRNMEEEKKSFISSEKISTNEESVFFMRNGQSHGELPRSFLKNDVGLSYIAKDMVVCIDCTNTVPSKFDRIFPPTRDVFRSNQLKEDVKSILMKELRSHEGLKALNEERKNKIITHETEKSEDVENFYNDLITHDPSIKFLLSGLFEIPERSGRGKEKEEYVGKLFPTILEIKDKEVKSTGRKKIPVNSYANLVLKTDAQNDYFSREIDKGSLKADVININLRSIRLHNGRITLKLVPTDKALVSKSENVKISVTRPYDSDLTVTLKVTYEKPIETRTNPSGPPKPPKSNKFNLPKLKALSKDEWEKMEFNIENLVELETMKSPETKLYILKEVYINTDFPFLNKYFQIHRYSQRQIAVMKQQFINAAYIAALTVHGKHAKKNSYPHDQVIDTLSSIGFCLPYILFTMHKKLLRELEDQNN